MTVTICPNYKECALVNNKLALDEHIYKYYIDNYCCCREGSWSDCTRFRAKEELNFCPDFVLPDTVMTADEIIKKTCGEGLNSKVFIDYLTDKYLGLYEV